MLPSGYVLGHLPFRAGVKTKQKQTCVHLLTSTSLFGGRCVNNYWDSWVFWVCTELAQSRKRKAVSLAASLLCWANHHIIHQDGVDWSRAPRSRPQVAGSGSKAASLESLGGFVFSAFLTFSLYPFCLWIYALCLRASAFLKACLGVPLVFAVVPFRSLRLIATGVQVKRERLLAPDVHLMFTSPRNIVEMHDLAVETTGVFAYE